jgi:hypothetical protein
MTLSAEEQNAVARAKLPPEAIELYGDMLTKLDKMETGMVGSGKEPDVVAQAYLKALTDPEPKHFYTVGIDAKALRIIGRISPQWLLDAIAARILQSGADDANTASMRR